jgi:hypothetical protein
VFSDAAAALLILERLEKLLCMAIAFDLDQVVVGYTGAGPPVNTPRATARLHRLQRQQHLVRLERQSVARTQARPADRSQGRREPRRAPRLRRQRAASVAAGRDPPSGPSGSSGGDEPPPNRVTLSRVCSVCGDDLSGRRRHAVTCGNRCRQQAHRDRQRESVTANGGREPVRISFELFRRLEAHANRRRRQRLEDLRQREAGVAA